MTKSNCKSIGYVGAGDHACKFAEGHKGRFHKAEGPSVITWRNLDYVPSK